MPYQPTWRGDKAKELPLRNALRHHFYRGSQDNVTITDIDLVIRNKHTGMFRVIEHKYGSAQIPDYQRCTYSLMDAVWRTSAYSHLYDGWYVLRTPMPNDEDIECYHDLDEWRINSEVFTNKQFDDWIHFGNTEVDPQPYRPRILNPWRNPQGGDEPVYRFA